MKFHTGYILLFLTGVYFMVVPGIEAETLKNRPGMGVLPRPAGERAHA
jgi:hypothetical protein